MSDQPANPDNTEFVLPIICPHCKKEINLAMIFALLAPDVVVPSPAPTTEDHESEEEET